MSSMRRGSGESDDSEYSKEHFRSGWSAPYVPPKQSEFVPSFPTLPSDAKWRMNSSNPFEDDAKHAPSELSGMEGNVANKAKQLGGFGAFPGGMPKPMTPPRVSSPTKGSTISTKEVAEIGKGLFSSIHSMAEADETRTTRDSFGAGVGGGFTPKALAAVEKTRRNFDLPNTTSYTGPLVPRYENKETTKGGADAGKDWEELFEKSFAGFSGQSLRPPVVSAPAPLPVAEVYYQQTPQMNYTNTYGGMDPFASYNPTPAPVRNNVLVMRDSDLDDFYAPVSSVKDKPPSPKVEKKKTLNERMAEQIMLLFVSGEITTEEKDWLLELGRDGNKVLRDALKAFENGDVEPFVELLKKRHADAALNDEAIARTLAGKNSPARKSTIVKKDDIISWDPKSDHNPPALLRLRGVDLCGDVMMRVRSKMITKKWKALFFQVHGDAIAAFETTQEWLYSRSPYFQKRLSAFMQVTKVSSRSYNDLPIYTIKLMENDRDYIDNGYNASFGFDVSLPVLTVAKFGSHNRKTVEYLSKELNDIIAQKITVLQEKRGTGGARR